MKTDRKPKTGIVFTSVFLSLILIATVWALLNRQYIQDTIKSWSYAPSAKVSQVENALNLTSAGDLIFRASDPTLISSLTSFQDYCPNDDSRLSILGCYANQTIYVHNIESEELPGINESVSAHEFLHAVWERMSDSERNSLANSIESVYQSHQELFADILSTYSEDVRLNELYARIGTEIEEIPDDLAASYAKYFSNRSQIVAFYDSYNQIFNELADRVEQLTNDMATLNANIEQQSSNYVEQATNLSVEVAEFNSCAAQANCFSSRSAFQSRRNELISKQNDLQNLYDEINEAIEDYNDMVSEYNSNILHSQYLSDIMNSNPIIEGESL